MWEKAVLYMTSASTLTLTPAQWLPKPATIWMPQVTKSLRESWSPGEREDRFQRFGDRNPVVSALELQPGANDVRSRNMCLPLPGGEGRGEGKRLPSQTSKPEALA